MELNKYVLSLDISTTNIGFCLSEYETGKLVELKHLELKVGKEVSIPNRIIDKSTIFKNYILNFRDRLLAELNGEIVAIAVEMPLGGSNNVNTVILLAGFNAICCFILYEIFNLYPIKITIHEIRKLYCPELVTVSYKKGEKVETLSFPEKYKKDKKLYIWEKTRDLEPQIEWFKKKGSDEILAKNYDMSDSYACSHAYFKQIGVLK